MDSSRRDLLKFTGVAGVATLLPAQIFAARAVSNDDGRELWQQRVSTSVLENATTAIANVVRTGHDMTADDMRLAMFATKTFVDHLEEVGYTKQHEKEVLTYFASPSAIPDTALASLSDAMRGRGVDIPIAELKRRLDLDDNRRNVVADQIRLHGLAAMLAGSSAALNTAALKLSNAPYSASALDIQGDVRAFDHMCGVLHAIGDLMLAVAALDFLGCAVGIAPFCVIALAFAIAGSLFLLAVDFIC